MGQQQLLLLVLATVIVGLATVAGIEAFNQNRDQAAADALTQDLVRFASEAQAAAAQPTQLGGVASLSDADSFAAVGISDSTSTNGDYNFGSAPSGAPGNVSCSATGGTTIYGYNSDTGVEACVEVTGTQSSDISTEVDLGS